MLTVRLRTTAGSRYRRARSPRHGTLSLRRRPFLTGSSRANLPRRPPPGRARDPAPGSSATRRTALPTILCGNPPIHVVAFIYIRNLHAWFTVFSLSTRKRDLRSSRARRTCINTWRNVSQARTRKINIVWQQRFVRVQFLSTKSRESLQVHLDKR